MKPVFSISAEIQPQNHIVTLVFDPAIFIALGPRFGQVLITQVWLPGVVVSRFRDF